MLARQIMSREAFFVLPTDAIWRAAELMRYQGVGCIPVVSDERSRRVVGILTDRDITTRCVARQHGPTCYVADHMTLERVHSVVLRVGERSCGT